MDVSKYLSVSDFMNYYLCGVTWILIPLVAKWSQMDALRTKFIGLPASNTGVLVWLLIVSPYVVGVALSPVSYLLRVLVEKVFEDPRKWVGEREKNSDNNLPEGVVESLQTLAKSILVQKGTTKVSLPTYFFYFRAYIAERGGESVKLADRALSLANLLESLIAPIPILAFALVWSWGTANRQNTEWVEVVSVLLAIALFCLLLWRYRKLRESWVKHVYRSFLIIATSEFPESTIA